MKLQKIGGYFSIALVFILLIYIGVTILGFSSTDPADIMATSQDSQIAFRAMYICIFLRGMLMLLISLTIKERMHSEYPTLMQLVVITASIYFAMIILMSMNGMTRLSLSADDLEVYKALISVWNIFTKAAGCALGLVFLIIGYAAIKTRLLPRILGGIFLLQGITVIPTILMGAPFIGVSLIPISFLWLGIHLIRNPEPNLE
ncbi:hypothetical protein ACFL1N_14180 [Thermodesulfobacteriota bacterium]